MKPWPNKSRGCVKTQIWSFWKTQKRFKSLSPKIKMRLKAIVSVALFSNLARWEFSYSLSLEPTAAPLSGLARLPFRAAGSSGCGSALIR
jgi:hypothetical protein